MDQALKTGGTLEEYRATVDPVIAEMSQHEKDAFDWAVSDFDLQKLHAKYPNSTARKIIRGEVKTVLDAYPDRIKSLEEEIARTQPLVDEIAKVEVAESQRSEEHTSELQSLMRISYAVFCLKKKNTKIKNRRQTTLDI